MNREILFRGKRVDNGEWIYGYLVADTADCSLKKVGKCVCKHDGTDAEIWTWRDDYHEYDSFVVDADTVGQYTGLTDKNGLPVYESDILFDEFGENYCVVKFGKYASPMGSDRFTANIGFYTAWIGKHKDLLRQDIGYWLGAMKETTRVVGNIHDNQDLLQNKGEG